MSDQQQSSEFSCSSKLSSYTPVEQFPIIFQLTPEEVEKEKQLIKEQHERCLYELRQFFIKQCHQRYCSVMDDINDHDNRYDESVSYGNNFQNDQSFRYRGFRLLSCQMSIGREISRIEKDAFEQQNRFYEWAVNNLDEYLIFKQRLTLSDYYKPSLAFSSIHPSEPYREHDPRPKQRIKILLAQYNKFEQIPLERLARVMFIAERPLTVQIIQQTLQNAHDFEIQ